MPDALAVGFCKWQVLVLFKKIPVGLASDGVSVSHLISERYLIVRRWRRSNLATAGFPIPCTDSISVNRSYTLARPYAGESTK